MELRYSEIEEALALQNSYTNATRIALIGRIKDYQRLRFPPHADAGKAVPGVYNPWQLLLLACAFEFAQIGIEPKRAIESIIHNIASIRRAVAAQISHNQRGPNSASIMLLFRPEALTSLQGLPRHDPSAIIVTQEQVGQALKGLDRAVLIDVSNLVDTCLTPACGNAAKHKDILADLEDWATQ